MEETEFYGTGRRKTSVARVWLRPGDGKIVVNSQDVVEYFPRPTLRAIINQPFDTTNTGGRYNVHATVDGGGVSGQAGALRHGIARALLKSDEAHKDNLRRNGFLTRDSRKKERKKYGQKGARAKFQFSKR